jgi:hypothetical protein
MILSMEDAVLHFLARAIVLAVIGTLTGCGGGMPDLSGTGGSGTTGNPYVLPEEN